MRLALAQVDPGGCDIEFVAPSDLFSDARDRVVACEPVRMSGRAQMESIGLHVWGRIATRLTLTCSRCLAEFPFPFEGRFDVAYAEIVGDEDEVELHGRELTVCHLEGDSVDLGELAHEQVLLGIPMAPLCSEGCKGLCPRCGANRNAGDCECGDDNIDPRMAALKNLL
ncbi:MAG: DUF177 domain-containing protein [Leptospirillia bacterium]